MPRVYTKKVIDFIRKCIKEGMSRRECKRTCEVEFQRYFNKDYLNQKVKKMGLYFKDGFNINDIHPILKKKSTKKFLLSHKKRNPYKKRLVTHFFRDLLIEKYETYVTIRDLKFFCRINRISLDKPKNSEKKVVYLVPYQKSYYDTFEYQKEGMVY